MPVLLLPVVFEYKAQKTHWRYYQYQLYLHLTNDTPTPVCCNIYIIINITGF